MYRAAAVVDGAGSPLAHCIILDISATGARLRLTSEPELPKRFTLHLSRDGRVRRLCEIVWREGSDMGLRFVDVAARRA